VARDYVNLVRHPDNAALFRAVEMSILAAHSQMPLHIHAEGLRGTGKTTILRSARSILPRIERVRGCLYNCDPTKPHCPEHAHLDETELAEIGTEWIPMPFLEISHSAKVATVVGGIDLEKLVNRAHPEAALLPGTLAQAHRGIVFIDEINRLADTSPELADILLDVMGTKPGRLQIEDAGLPTVEITSLVTVWAASNPDEDPGPLEGIRRQLADRFDLCVDVKRPSNHATVMAILQPELRMREWQAPEVQQTVAARLTGGLYRLARQTIATELLSFLAHIYLDHGLESLRALEAITLAAKVHAALVGKENVEKTDLQAVIPMALKHRTLPHVLADILDELNNFGKVAEEAKPAEAALAAATAPSSTVVNNNEPNQANRSFLSRLFASIREPAGEENESADEDLLPGSPQAALSPASTSQAKRTWLDASLADPEMVNIIAPPRPASALPDVPESRLVMGQTELERER